MYGQDKDEKGSEHESIEVYVLYSRDMKVQTVVTMKQIRRLALASL